jgi:hypothetical protein
MGHMHVNVANLYRDALVVLLAVELLSAFIKYYIVLAS